MNVGRACYYWIMHTIADRADGYESNRLARIVSIFMVLMLGHVIQYSLLSDTSP